MAGFSRFLKRWATTGAILEPTDAQADAGFAFLGATPPSVELFNAMMQQYDDKDNTLYAWIAAVLTAAGIVPADASPGQLLAALSALHGVQVFTTPGSFTVPAGVTKAAVEGWGGGGGGGGGGSSSVAGNGGGGGGGGGYFRRLVVGLTPLSTVGITVGSGGASATNVGAAGSPGTTSGFGSYCSATGGVGGTPPDGNNPGRGGQGGTGVGGDYNAQGSIGGFPSAFWATPSGVVYVNGGTGGANGSGGGWGSPGSGGNGNDDAGNTPPGFGEPGTVGFAGLVIVRW